MPEPQSEPEPEPEPEPTPEPVARDERLQREVSEKFEEVYEGNEKLKASLNSKATDLNIEVDALNADLNNFLEQLTGAPVEASLTESISAFLLDPDLSSRISEGKATEEDLQHLEEFQKQIYIATAYLATRKPEASPEPTPEPIPPSPPTPQPPTSEGEGQQGENGPIQPPEPIDITLEPIRAPEVAPTPPTAASLQQARQEIEKIKGIIKRDLTEEEKQVVYARFIGQSMSQIDQKTNQLLEQYSQLTKQSKFKKIMLGALRMTGIMAAGMGARYLLNLIPGFNFAGTVVGGVFGAAIGGFSARKREMASSYGAKAIFDEYQAIKAPNTPEAAASARKDALAFLQRALESKTFKGDLSGLLQLLALYRKDAVEAIAKENPDQVEKIAEGESAPREMKFGEARVKIDEAVISAFLSEVVGRQTTADELVRGFINNPNTLKRIRGATVKGAIKGAVIGAGLGLLGDVISNWVTHVQTERGAAAYDQSYQDRLAQTTGQNWNYQNEFNVLNVQPSGAELAHGMTQSTDYGNALSHALDQAYRSGQLHLPNGMSQEQFQELVHAANFANPLPDHLNVPVGTALQNNVFHFNQTSLNEFVGRAFDQGNLNYAAIQDADRIILGINQALASEATNFAAQAAASAGHATAPEAAMHGIAAAMPVVGAQLGGIGRKGQADNVEVGSLSLPAREQAAPVEQPAQQDEQAQTIDQAVAKWKAKGNALTRSANELFSEAKDKGWSALTDQQKVDLQAIMKVLAAREASEDGSYRNVIGLEETTAGGETKFYTIKESTDDSFTIVNMLDNTERQMSFNRPSELANFQFKRRGRQ